MSIQDEELKRTLKIGEQTQLPSCLRQMLEQECCTDVTLCCQGRQFRAHRVLLSACSTYLQEILLIHRKKKHATVILQDVRAEDMESLLRFLYSGEVTLPEERLESFISLAHQLKISIFIDKHLYEKSITLDRHVDTGNGPSGTGSGEKKEKRGSWDDAKAGLDAERFRRKRSFDCDTKPTGSEQGQKEVLKESYLIAQKLGSTECGTGPFERYDQFVSRLDAGNAGPCLDVKPESDVQTAFHCNVNYQHLLSSLTGFKPDDSKFLVNASSHSRLSHPEHLFHYFHDQLNYGYNFVTGSSLRPKGTTPDWPWVGHGPWSRPETHLPVPIISPVVGKDRFGARNLKSSPGGILTPSPWAQNKIPCVGGIRRPTPKRPVVIPSCPPPGPTVCEEPVLNVSMPCIVKPHIFNEEPSRNQIHCNIVRDPALDKAKDKTTLHEPSGTRQNQVIYHRTVAPESYTIPQHPDHRPIDFLPGEKHKPPGVEAKEFPKTITRQSCSFDTPSKDDSRRTPGKDSADTSTPKPFNDTNNNSRFQNEDCSVLQLTKLVCHMCKQPCGSQVLLEKHMAVAHVQGKEKHVTLAHVELKEKHVTSAHAEMKDKRVTVANAEVNDKHVTSAHVEIKDKHVTSAHVEIKETHVTHGELTSFVCVVCQTTFEDREQWVAHQKIHAEASPSDGKKSLDHECTDCGKKFVTRASLKVHMRTHTGEKPFHCTECGKQFSQLRNYKYHRSVHEGTKEFAATCPECGKYFNDRGYLSSHMKIHRNRKEYGCEFCGKSFNQRVAYNMHVRIHTGEKPHVCPHCGKCFSRKMLLKQHLRIHTGEKPFQCVICQKAFADRSNMTLHMRLHSGVKPYTCTVCSKSFTKKHHLKTHMNYHTGVKPYSCQKCGLKFSQSSNMRTHYKKCMATPPKPGAQVPVNLSSS